MVWESSLFMAWCAFGTFQIVASWASLNGLSLFNYRIAGYVFGSINIAAAFCWFFSTIEIGENGAKGQHYEQIVSVIAGVGLAALVTGIVSSIIKCRSFDGPESNTNVFGLEVFKNHTLFQLINQYLNRRRRKD